MVISTLGGDGAHPPDPTKNKKQNLNPNFILFFIFQKNIFLVVISTPVGYFDPGGDPPDPTKNKKQNLNPNLFLFFIFFQKISKVRESVTDGLTD